MAMNDFQREAVNRGLMEPAANGEVSLDTLVNFAFKEGSLLLTVDGEFECGPIRKKKDKFFTLEDMQSAVGGYVDIARLSETGRGILVNLLTDEEISNLSEKEANEIVNDLELVVNDEGMNMNLATNTLASLISEQGLLVGPVVLARRSGWE